MRTAVESIHIFNFDKELYGKKIIAGSPIGRVPRLGPDDVDRAVQRARTAQRRWARTPMRERSRVLLALHDLI